MSYSRFTKFLHAHRLFQIIYVGLGSIINYFGLFWLVALIKPEWATETFDFWLGLVCLFECLAISFGLTRWWRIEDALGLRERAATPKPE